MDTRSFPCFLPCFKTAFLLVDEFAFAVLTAPTPKASTAYSTGDSSTSFPDSVGDTTPGAVLTHTPAGSASLSFSLLLSDFTETAGSVFSHFNWGLFPSSDISHFRLPLVWCPIGEAYRSRARPTVLLALTAFLDESFPKLLFE